MDADALIVNIRGMVAQNPVELTFGAETHDVGVANLDVSERQIVVGLLKSYKRSVWIVKEDWTSLPGKGDLVTIASESYRVLDYKDYYMDVARRLDLGTKYESGRN
jgi:hypothetical protein